MGRPHLFLDLAPRKKLRTPVGRVAAQQPDGSPVINPMELREAVSTPKLKVGLSSSIASDENGDRVGEGGTTGLAMC